MAKQLNVDMRFNADTSQAKRAIQDLQNSLSTIAKMPGNASNLFDDTEIKKASKAALELQGHLQKAVNVNTGKLDLSRFASSLKTSNKDLSIYANTLLNTGKQGQQAFLQLAQAIATADTPVTRINAKLTDLGVTLKNTAKWQISSSVLHGFMGAVQSAYGYAQDLNESLNNIRIVTGQNIDQMARFAETANRAAKALSTTTTDYTNASLIYYQQGLNDQQVQERTDITIKMANVARQSAEVVSDQMTAVWNNFDNGSKSLEYYADVMTALGAATASSTDEIAAGLEKFAAVSETVGLSYEYATAALATVTDKTRQSADVVGTAFKTMFARIQGLKLGETLEDGTDFNQYSEALMAVGVNIKTANGELKNMDTILNEMAAVWETLNRDEQVALAQKVAGVRQYNQLVSLMENWDAMEMNLGVVETSEGALQEQADIYAESWEAAQDRVRAAAEGVYQDLIDDEFFITLLNGFEKVIETIDGVVQGLGGMQGVITLVGSLFLTQFAQKMPEALNNLRQNFMVFTGQSKKVMSEMQNELNLTITTQKADPGLSESYKIQLEGIQKINTMKQKLVAVSKSLTSQEQEEYKMKIQNVEAMYKEAAALAEKKKAAEELEKKTQRTAETTANRKSNDTFKQYNDSEAEVSNLMDKATTPSKSAEETAIYAIKIEEARKKAVELEMSIEKIGKAAELSGEEIQALMGVGTANQQAAAQDKVAKKVKETSEAFKAQIKQRSNLEEMSSAIVSQGEAWEKVAQEVKKVESDKVKNLSSTIDTTKQKMAAYLQIIQKIASDNGLELNAEDIAELANKIKTLDSSNIEEVTQGFSTFAKEVSGKAQNAIGGLDASIEQLRGTMADLQFDSTEVDEMEQAAAGAATATQELRNSMDNIGGIADENVKGTFKMSVALTEFASVAMSVSSLVSSLQGAISTFTDEGASGFEKFGALLSTIMPIMSTFNALQAVSKTLSENKTIADAAMIVMEKLHIVSKSGETAAVIANNAAWMASPIFWIGAIVLGVVAALGLLVTGISAVTKALKDSYNADAIAAENAAQAADNLADEYEKTKEAYEDMISTMENYETARDGLNSLAKGTQEYRDQLNKANEEALKLIETLGLIKGSGYDIVNGEIIINKDSEDYQTKTQEFEYSTQKAQAASYIANAESEKATAKSDQTALARTQNQSDLYGTFENSRIDQLTQQYKKMGSAAFDASNLISLGFDTANEKYIDNVKKQVATNLEASDSMETAMELASQAILSLDENIEKSSQKETISTMGKNAYNLTYATEKSNVTEQMTQEEWQLGIASGAQKNIWEEYIKINKELQGLTDLNVTNFKADGSVEYEYTEYDDSGKKTTKTDEVSAEVIAIALANERTADKLLANSDTLNSLANRLATDETINKEFASFTADQNLNDLTYKELSSIETPESFGALRDKITEIFSDEELSALGYNNAESYAAAFILGYNSTMSEWEGLEGFADYSLGEAQSLSHISSQTGQSTDEVSGYYDGLNEEEKSIFLTLDFDENQSKENWDRAIENIKEEKIEVQIEAKTSKAASEYGLDADQLNDVAEAFSDMDEIMGDNTATTEEIAEAASDAAVRYVRLQNAVIDLSENYEDYKDILTDIQDSSSDVDKAMILNGKNSKALKGALAGLIGTTEDLIDANLISAIDPKDFKAAAAGDEAAIERIREAFIDVQADAIDTKNVLVDSLDTDEEITTAANNFKAMMDGLDEGATIDIDNSPFLQALIQSSIAAGDTEADIINKLSGFGIDVDTVSFHNSLESARAAAEACGGDVVEALSYSTDTEVEPNQVDTLGSKLNYDEDITPEEITVENEVLEIEDSSGATTTKKLSTTHYAMDKRITAQPVPTTESETTTNVTQTAKQGKGQSKYAVVGGSKKSVGNRVSPSTAKTARNNVNKGKSGGGGGGGGPKPKPAQPTKKSDIVDRYKEVEDELDDIKRTSDNTSESLNRLYGKDKLEAINKLIEAEKEYKNTLKEKRDEAKDNLTADKKALNDAAKAVDVQFTYDASGNITNYTEQMEALYNRLRDMEKAAGKEWDENEQKQIEAFKEKIEQLKEAQSQYEETRELIEDIADELKKLAGQPALSLIKSDSIDIYKEIIDALDDIERRVDRINKRADEKLGKDRLEYFDKFQSANEDKLTLIEDELDKNKTDKKEKSTHLEEVRKLLDINQKVQFDEKGNISNYEEISDILYQRLFNEQKKAASDKKISPAEQEALDAIQQDIDMWEEAVQKYTEANDYGKDLNEQKRALTDNVTVLPLVTDDFLEIYKETDDILDDIDHKISKISQEADRMTGPSKVAKLKELAQLEKEKLAYIEEQQEINKSDIAEKKTALGTTRKKLGITTKFDIDKAGNITNYNEVMAEYKKIYDEAYTKANSDGIINAEEAEWLEQFAKDGEFLQEYIDQYSEAVEKGEDLEEQALEAKQNVEDYIFEAMAYTVELNIEADDRDLQYIDYQLSKIEDQAYMAAEALSLMEHKLDSLGHKSDIYTKGIDKILSKYVKSGDITSQQFDKIRAGDTSTIKDWSFLTEDDTEKLKEYADGLLDVNDELLALRETMDEAVIKAFEEWSSEMKEQLELFDHYDAVINHYTNIIDIAGQEKLGVTNQQLKEYNQLKVNNANNKLFSSKTYYDETKEKIDLTEAEKRKAQQRLNKAKTSKNQDAIAAAEKDVKAWEETLDAMYEESRKAEQTYLADWEAALKASKDAFLATVKIELEELEKRMSGTYGSISAMQKDFNQHSEINNRYLQDYERMYELSKLSRDLNKKMDETTNIKAKKELAKLQEEITEYQEEGRKISDYDLKYLQKRYDLKVAEIAMEEAHNAKTQVRLTRDSEGNFSYTYTADEKEMDKAQQTYEDKLYDITNLSNEHIEKQTSQLLQTQQDYINALNEIYQKQADGQYATTEEYQKAIDDCTAYYVEKMRFHGGEIDKATLNNAVIYADDYATYEHYIGEKLTQAEKLQLEMDADIIEAKAKAEKLVIERQAALDEIHRLQAEGYYATEKEYQEALAKVDETYNQRILGAKEEVDILVGERVLKYGEDADAYSLETARKTAAEEGFVTSVKEFLPQLETAHSSVSGYVEDMATTIGSAEDRTGYLGVIMNAYDAFQTNLENNMENAGTSIEEFKDDAYEKLISDDDSIANQSKDTKKSIEKMAKAASALDDTIAGISTWQKNYSTNMEKTIRKNEETVKSINTVIEALADLADAQASKKTSSTSVKVKDSVDNPIETAKQKNNEKEVKCSKCGKVKSKCKCSKTATTDKTNKTDSKNTLETASTTTKKGVAYAVWSGYWGNDTERKNLLEKKLGKGAYKTYQTLVNDYKIAKKASDGTWELDLYGKYHSTLKEAQNKLKKDYGPSASFFTGGYTGKWGSSGKLAILHEKELILNKEDTENMLKMITMVRDLSKVLDLKAHQSSLAQLAATGLQQFNNTSGDTLQQTVTITAEFPGAVYASEIETALTNLVNSASQFANRKY